MSDKYTLVQDELDQWINCPNNGGKCCQTLADTVDELNHLLDRIKRLGEFVDQLTNPKFTRDDLPKEALLQRIKRLEEAGDALKAAGYFGGWADAVNKWIKVKEAKP